MAIVLLFILGVPWHSTVISLSLSFFPLELDIYSQAPGEGNGNPLQYSCLENPMDKGAWWAIIHGVAKSLTRLSD